VGLLKKLFSKCRKRQTLIFVGCISLSPVIKINVQPVENRRRKSAHRGKEAPRRSQEGTPPHHGSQSTVHMMPYGNGRAANRMAKAQRKKGRIFLESRC